MEGFFATYFVIPLLNVIILIYKALESLQVPWTFGFAVIAFTVLMRFVMHPLFKKQMETQKALTKIKPKIDAVQKKYKNDKEQLQKEQLRIYQEAGINPAAGCVLMFVQMPVFIALYSALNFILSHSSGDAAINQINELLYFPGIAITTFDATFAGLNLLTTPAQAALWWYYLVPVLTGILQYFQAAAMMTSSPMPSKKGDKDGKKDSEPAGTAEEFQRAMQTQIKYVFPVMIGIFSFNFPVALSLYWNTFSVFSIIQYRMMKAKDDEAEVEADNTLKAKTVTDGDSDSIKAKDETDDTVEDNPKRLESVSDDSRKKTKKSGKKKKNRKK